jgi:hypothetical protein
MLFLTSSTVIENPGKVIRRARTSMFNSALSKVFKEIAAENLSPSIGYAIQYPMKARMSSMPGE